MRVMCEEMDGQLQTQEELLGVRAWRGPVVVPAGNSLVAQDWEAHAAPAHPGLPLFCAAPARRHLFGCLPCHRSCRHWAGRWAWSAT